jgi:hypothetical protein
VNDLDAYSGVLRRLVTKGPNRTVGRIANPSYEGRFCQALKGLHDNLLQGHVDADLNFADRMRPHQ